MTLPNFSALPPEVNSAQLLAGAGPEPMLAAAASWDCLAFELHSAAASFGQLTTGLSSDFWHGPAAQAMTAAAAPYLGWLTESATGAEETAGLARAVASEFGAAVASTVHPSVIAANRAHLVSLVTANLFGQNAPAIATIEGLYEQMWAQDVSAMTLYHAGASGVVARLAPWRQLQGLLGSVGGTGTAAASGVPELAAAVTATANTAAAQTVAEVMGASGYPIPSSLYVAVANRLYVSRSVLGAVGQSLFTPEGLYPVSRVKSLTFDISVSQGVTMLDNAIRQQLGAGNNVTVFGYSQSATIASLEMARLAASVNMPSPDQLSFTLIGNPSNPNGGVATRFPGLGLPAFGATSTIATPDNLYPTRIYTIEYDGVADFPRYPINVPATLNAIFGAYYVHNNYFLLTPAQLDAAVPLTNTVGPTMTQYFMIRTENLPLLEPIRAIPIVGDPIADLVQPDLKVIVNLGYGDPAYGYSTEPPNVHTPFGLFPSVDAGTVVAALVAGTQQGVSDFAHDISQLGLSLPTELSSQSPASPTTNGSSVGAVVPTFSLDDVIAGLQGANTRVFKTIAGVTSAGYATLLPTADIVNTLLTTAPSYDINLILDGIEQALDGDPMGLVNAVGYPIAADVALIAVAGGIELLVIHGAIIDISAAITG